MINELRPVKNKLERIITCGTKLTVGGVIVTVLAAGCVSPNPPRLVGEQPNRDLKVKKTTTSPAFNKDSSSKGGAKEIK